MSQVGCPLRAPRQPRVVHLELHTHDIEAASGFYSALFGWRTHPVASRWGTYHAVMLGDSLAGGIVECGRQPAGWLPYVEVEPIDALTERARELGSSVLLGPREGPAGWRSVISTPAGGELALWKHKR